MQKKEQKEFFFRNRDRERESHKIVRSYTRKQRKKGLEALIYSNEEAKICDAKKLKTISVLFCRMKIENN